MRWNWQQPGWPRFSWDPDRLKDAEVHFARLLGELSGTQRHFSTDQRNDLLIAIMGEAASATSEIEGEMLERSSIRSSLRRAYGLQTPRTRARPRESAIADVMIDVYRTFERALDDGMLFRWHERLMRDRSDITVRGAYRNFPDAMQIVSGDQIQPTVHFEAPPSARVPAEMQIYLDWLRETAPENATVGGLARAALAHLHFESIHPFEDGNGRIGRAICDKILAQAAGTPLVTLLSETLLYHRKAYYAELATATRSLEITRWLQWFAERILEGQFETLRVFDHTLKKANCLDAFGNRMNERQQKAVVRLFDAGPDGFIGGLSASKYIHLTGASTATATRDLSGLVDLGLFTHVGTLKHRRYFLALEQTPRRLFSIEPSGKVRLVEFASNTSSEYAI